MAVDPLINPETITIPLRQCTCSKNTHKMPASAARSKALRNCRLIQTENIDNIDAAFQPYLDQIDDKIDEYRDLMFRGHRSPRYGHACEKFEWWKECRIMWEVEKGERCVKVKGEFYKHWQGERFDVRIP